MDVPLRPSAGGRLRRLALLATLAVTLSCGGDSAEPERNRSAGVPSTEDTSGSGSERDVTASDATDAPALDGAAESDGTGVPTDAGGPDGAGDTAPDTATEDTESALLPGERPCAQAVLDASVSRVPVDILIFIDTSGSMGQETQTVVDSIQQFTEFIASSQLDYRVILVGATTICFPPPLSSSVGCPDRNGPRYFHVRLGVASTDGLVRTIEGLDRAESFARPDAQLHVIAVTDDESQISAETFLDDIGVRRTDVVVHGIVATDDNGSVCCGPRGCGARVGNVYARLADTTGGVLASICEADWLPTFQAIAESVATRATRPCEYALPDPGPDAELDPERANVFYAEPGGDRTLLPAVGSSLECAGRLAWHYDRADAPSRILLCPSACELQSATVSIELGCDTVKR